jgi:4-diphosphocytidyl-2-C-methyl-D-erythritol kinase
MVDWGWPAPAKLNLFLHIVGRREDRYHKLQTVFQFLDYADELRFEITIDPRIRRLTEVPGVPAAEDLIVRAATCLQKHAGVRHGVAIALEKRLPMGGGLGGGSSDAATTLVALNQLWDLHLEPAVLARLGLTLGADVPVFVHGQAAWAEGVGEELTVMPELDEPWYLVVKPDCNISTAEVFSAPELTRDTQPIRIRDFLSGQGRNDCTAVVRARYPGVAAALDWLAQSGDSRLTGTGACVFARFDSQDAAEARLKQLPASWWGVVARGCNQSPLLRHLATVRTTIARVG